MAATWLWSSTLSSRETSKWTRTRTNWSRTGRLTWSTGEKTRTVTRRATIPTEISAQMKNRRIRIALKISKTTKWWSLALMMKTNSSMMKAIVNQAKMKVLNQRVVLAVHRPWPPSNLSRKRRGRRTKKTRRSKRNSVSKTKTWKRKRDSRAWMRPLEETGLLSSQLALREARADILRLAGNPAEIKSRLTAPWHPSSTLLQTEAARVPSRQVTDRDAFDCKLSLWFDYEIHTLEKH